MRISIATHCQVCANYRKTMPSLEAAGIPGLVEAAVTMFRDHKADHMTEVNKMIDEVWSDLRRGSADDAQQSFGDLMVHLGLDEADPK